MSNEADTCRKYVLPKLRAAGWTDDDQIGEQITFTDGRILVSGRTARRGKPKRADYLLRYLYDFPLAVIEAKADYRSAGDGMQQAKNYAEMLGLVFAFATNGKGIIEFDFATGIEQPIDQFPSPRELWNRWRTYKGLDEVLDNKLLVSSHISDKQPRYYQQIAINRAMEAIVSGKQRLLLTLATGTGKTLIAFQIAWKLWSSYWNKRGAPQRHPRILYLADRTFLVDDPKDKIFAPFGEARYKIEHGKAEKSREIYFATYQAIAEDEHRPGLFREYASDFFDLLIIDEAHRGSARNDSTWREILEYFAPATQLGMTATPLRDVNRDTYAYFGEALYEYSLKQGIQDGFLAPYQVRRVVTSIDATGFRPHADQRDDYGRTVPDRVYTTQDFDRTVAISARTEAVAQHLTAYLKSTNRQDKTIVFCRDQEHADEMRRAIGNANADLVRQHPNYVVRITADDGDLGKTHLATFQDVEATIPTIVTTSYLLSTGVDAPTVKNVVLFRPVNSMVEFKQIIGRGTRVREDYDKLFFTIIDYTGSATQQFADPDFDGEATQTSDETLDAAVAMTLAETVAGYDTTQPPNGPNLHWRDTANDPRKYRLSSGVVVTIVHEMVQELDASGKQLRVVELTSFTGEQVRILAADIEDLRKRWATTAERAKIIVHLGESGIDLAHVATIIDQPEADPFDLLCHLAFSAPLHTRRERADRLHRERQDFFYTLSTKCAGDIGRGTEPIYRVWADRDHPTRYFADAPGSTSDDHSRDCAVIRRRSPFARSY